MQSAEKRQQDSPGGLEAKTPSLPRGGAGFNPCRRTKVPQATLRTPSLLPERKEACGFCTLNYPAGLLLDSKRGEKFLFFFFIYFY